MALKTRTPTGQVPWPLVLIEGPEKVGKTWACAEFSGCPRVGQMYWLDLGEASADEYGAIPGAAYEILIHDGSWASILGAVEDVRDEAQRVLDAGRPPVVLTIDTMSAEWELLKDWAGNRARGSRSNRAKLEKDPNAEIVISTSYWNDANTRHRKLMKLLMTFPGIVLMTARGKLTAVMDEAGKPIEGQKEYKVDGQKTLGFDASCWVRLSHDEPGIVVGLRSVHAGIRPGRDKAKPLPDDWSIEWLIFDALRCDPKTAHVRDLVDPKAERTPEQIRDEAILPGTTADRIRELYREAKHDLAVDVPNETGGDEPLGVLLVRLGKARGKADEPAHKRMHALWRQAGFENDRDGRIRFTAEILGRPDITTSSELTMADAVKVCDRLTSYIKNNTPEGVPA